MTVLELSEKLNLEILSLGAPSAEIDGVYAGDLLSWVMSHAQADNVWVTIMTNLNVIAVASLVGTACVIIAENAALDEEVIRTAREKEINLFRSTQPIFDICRALSECLS